MESPKGLSETFAYWTSLESSGFPSGLRPSGKSDKSREFLRIFFQRAPTAFSLFVPKYEQEDASRQ